MFTRINLSAAFILLFLLAGNVDARLKLKVDKKAISVSSPTTSGAVVVWGDPGSVQGPPPISVMIFNLYRQVGYGGLVHDDGSFSVTLPAYYEDKLKVEFTGGDRRRTSIKLNVPAEIPSTPAAVEAVTVPEEVEVIEGVVSPPIADEEPATTEDVDAPEISAPLTTEDKEPAAAEEVESTDAPQLPPAIVGQPVVSEKEESAEKTVLPPAVAGEPVVSDTADKEATISEESDAPPPADEEVPITEEVEVIETSAPAPVEEQMAIEEGEGLEESAQPPVEEEKPPAAE